MTAAGLKEMLEGLNQKRASKVLIARGLLKPGSDGKSSQSLSIAASGQKSTRVYVFEMPEEEEA